MKTFKVVWLGDSITAGNHVSAGECYTDLVALALPSGVYANIAVPSATCDSAGQLATANGLYDGTKQVNVAAILFGANDGVTKSAATFESDLATLAAGLNAGFTRLVLTMLPCGSYDSVAFRAAVNPNARVTYPNLADLGNTGTTMGAEAAKTDGTLYSDTVHPTALGNTYLAPIVTAAILALVDEPGTVAWRSV